MLNKFETYDHVVVNAEPDTVVYEIAEIKNGWAHLTYMSGYKKVGGGDMPVELLRKPTKTQLKNSGLE